MNSVSSLWQQAVIIEDRISVNLGQIGAGSVPSIDRDMRKQPTAAKLATIRSWQLSGDKAVVFRVRTNPEPDDLTGARHRSERSISDTDSNGVDVRVRGNGLEPKTGMIRVVLEQSIGFTGRFFHVERRIAIFDPEAR
jgi:hypothetical protein